MEARTRPGSIRNTNNTTPLTLNEPPHVISYHRRMHYLFLAAYALMSSLFIIGCAIWINYRSIFQSGIIGFSHILTGILIGVYIPANTIEAWVPGDVPANHNERHEQRKRREYKVFKKSASSLILIAIISILLSSIYLYNLGYILIAVCPTLATEDAIINPTVVNIEIAYRHKPLGEFYAKKSVLVLRYNTTSQSIVRKTRDSNPNVANYDRWFVQNEVKTLSAKELAKNSSEPFCIKRTDSMLFSFLENEIAHFMYKNLHERYDSQSIRVNDKFRMQTTDEDEEDMDLQLLTSKICRHEYAFVIGIITFLLLWDILSVALIIYCIYLIRT